MGRTRRYFVLVSLLMGAFAFSVMPASAQPSDAPGAFCRSIDNTFPPIDERPFPFELATTGACASSVAQGFNGTGSLTTAAFVGQCKFLEDEGVVSYPYAFYGNPDYLANDRADCMRLLRGFHEGTLIPGPGNSHTQVSGARRASSRHLSTWRPLVRCGSATVPTRTSRG